MSSRKHQIAVFPFSLWGHARPIPAFVTRVSQRAPSIEISCFVPLHVFDKFRLELTRQFGTHDEAQEALKSRIKLNRLEITDKWASPAAYQEKFEEEYAKLCAAEDTHPDVVVVDIVMPTAIFDLVHHMAKRPVKVVCWNPIAVSTIFAQPFYDFSADMDAVYKRINEAQAARQNGYDDAANFIYEGHLTGKAMNIPGLPPLVDYEGYSQEPPLLQPRMTNIEYMENFVSNEGMICTSPYDLEPQAYDALTGLLAAHGSEAFSLGPFIPDANAPEVRKAELEQSDSKGIVEFLDRMAIVRGHRSTLYLAFGTIFYPLVPEKLYEVIKVVLELDIPLVMVQPVHAPPLPEALTAKFTDQCYVCAWAPQQYILSHPAVGFFLSHHGLNSTVEAANAGMPMIGWPHYGDQPFLAVLVEHVHKSGYELSEVRQGHGMQTRGNGVTPKGTLEAVAAEAKAVLHKAFFDEADRKEKSDNALALAKKLQATWAEGGRAWATLDAFIAFVHRPPQTGRVRKRRAQDRGQDGKLTNMLNV
ncbi:hypothetical protein C8J57DRAFT_1499173 [Mycena rebaudengoi]|nr:hypothetical protein C8J57DRAFT_1499173 [Mycena rebaudengoi]